MTTDKAQSRPLEVLLLCDFSPGSAGTIKDHIRAIVEHSANNVTVLNSRGYLDRALPLEAFDVVMVHYTLAASIDSFLPPESRRRIRDFTGVKVGFVQDDYRWIDRTVSVYRYLRIDLLFVLAPDQVRDRVYDPDRLGARTITLLAGYVPEELVQRQVPRIADRPTDVGYRGRELPAWLGRLSQDKSLIGPRFSAHPSSDCLVLDLAHKEAERLYGERWIEFLTSCKAVLGTESGASVADFSGEIQRAVEVHVEDHPDASFEELQALYFAEDDGDIVMNVVSPRCFEAAALRTLMILYEGEYSGVLKPWQHYLPLRKDHANQAEIVDALLDAAGCQQIVDRAYEEVARNPAYGFEAMASTIDAAIGEVTETQLGRNPTRRAATLPARRTKQIQLRAAVRNRLGLDRFGPAAGPATAGLSSVLNLLEEDAARELIELLRIKGVRLNGYYRSMRAHLGGLKHAVDEMLPGRGWGAGPQAALAKALLSCRLILAGKPTFAVNLSNAEALEYLSLLHLLRLCRRRGTVIRMQLNPEQRLLTIVASTASSKDSHRGIDVVALAADEGYTLEWSNEDDWSLPQPLTPGSRVPFSGLRARNWPALAQLCRSGEEQAGARAFAR